MSLRSKKVLKAIADNFGNTSSSTYKISKFNALILDCDGKIKSMSGVAIECNGSARIGHARTMYMELFNYDQFVKKGYSYTQNGNIVFKIEQANLFYNIKKVIGLDMYKVMLVSLIKDADLIEGMEDTFIRNTVWHLFHRIFSVSNWELNRLQKKSNTKMVRIIDFKCTREK